MELVNLSYANSELFEFESASRWLKERRVLTCQLCAAYILLLFVGKRVMRDREPLQLKKMLVAWNLALALFSIRGTFGTLPELLQTFFANGFRHSFCKTENFYEGENGFWTYMFVLSKALELGDSFFLVLRKRPLHFLHWYHHATVLLLCWLSYPYKMAAVRWCVCMNFLVHSFMYTYFLVRAVGWYVPGWVARGITSMQLLQFMIGVGITMDTVFRVTDCDTVRPVALVQLFLYVSYLVLFANFFYNAYIKGGKSDKGGKGKKQHVE